MIDFWKTQHAESYGEAKTSNHSIHYLHPDTPPWLAIRTFLKHPWFLRAWTFHEIVLAQEAVLYCGAHSLRWQRLEAFLVGMNTYSEDRNTKGSRLKGAEKSAGYLQG